MTYTLRGRIQIYRGNIAEARTIVETLRALLASAKVKDPNARMNRGDDVLLRMVELSLEPSEDYRWGKLHRRSRAALQLQPYEIVELLEGRARNAARRNDFAQAEQIFVEAFDLAQKSATAVADRVGRSLRDLQVVAWCVGAGVVMRDPRGVADDATTVGSSATCSTATTSEIPSVIAVEISRNRWQASCIRRARTTRDENTGRPARDHYRETSEASSVVVGNRSCPVCNGVHGDAGR